jgi:hypothetical protein
MPAGMPQAFQQAISILSDVAPSGKRGRNGSGRWLTGLVRVYNGHMSVYEPGRTEE